MKKPDIIGGALAGQQRILSFAIKDKAALYVTVQKLVKHFNKRTHLDRRGSSIVRSRNRGE